jgi:uroporphyrinogen decarboxylase
MQSRRERVLTALNHREPERIPFSWGFGSTGEMGAVLQQHYAKRGIDWATMRRETDDIVRLAPKPYEPPTGNIWGIQTQRSDYENGSYNEFCNFPLAGMTDAAQLDAYPWPDAAIYDDTGFSDLVSKANPEHGRAVMTPGGNPFEIYCWLTGLEEAMMNLVLAPAVVRRALDHITSFFEERLTRALPAAASLIDLVFLADDLGSQTGLLMSREMYRDFLQPYHRRLAEAVHRLAPHVKTVFHSDGAVFDAIPDLIEAGVDVLEAVQTDAVGMDPARLKREYGRDLCFHGGISVQQLLPHADATTVQDECRRLVDTLGQDGGYIAAPSHAIQIGTPPENVDAMLRALGRTP